MKKSSKLIILLAIFLVSCSSKKLYEGNSYTFTSPSGSYTKLTIRKEYVIEERYLNLPCIKDSIKISTIAPCMINVKSNTMSIGSVLRVDTLNTNDLDALRDTNDCVAQRIKSVIDIYNDGFGVEKKPNFCKDTTNYLSYEKDKDKVFEDLIVGPSYISNKDTFFISKKYPKYLLHKSKGPWFSSGSQVDTNECLNFLLSWEIKH